MGRPKIGNVLYSRRVAPEKVAVLDSILRGGKIEGGAQVSTGSQMAVVAKEGGLQGEPDGIWTYAQLKQQLAKVSDDYDREYNEKVKLQDYIEEREAWWEARREKWMLADESDKVRFLAYELQKEKDKNKIKMKRNEFDQESI